MSLVESYNIVRNATKIICKNLQTEDCVLQPAVFVSPPKWHLAHTTWFFEEFILKAHYREYVVFDTDFSFLFNSYYNTVGKRVLRAQRGNLSRPTMEKVYEYRDHVDGYMQTLLNTEAEAQLKNIVELGLNHEQQHQELLFTDIKYILGNNPLFPAFDTNLEWEMQKNRDKEFITCPGGLYEIGFNGGGFSFDNEHGRHKVYLDDFEIASGLVTNGEFMEFIDAAGYSDFNYWLDEGWSWVNGNNINAPLYWYKIEGDWHCYTLSGFKKVDPYALLTHVSFYEAAAFAEWKQMRLPTEFEWEVASDGLDWGKRWEWTNSAYLPYPRFKKPKGAIGEYNGKFMVNQMVLRGASCATPAGHSRKTYRNFFHPDERWQFNGIRLVKL